MKPDLKQQVYQAAEALFRNKLASGELSLRPVVRGCETELGTGSDA